MKNRHNKKRSKIMRPLALLLMILAALAPAAAFAAGNPFELTVKQIFTDSSSASADAVFTYRLAPLKADAPMPAGSTAEGYTFTIAGNSSVKIGPAAAGRQGVFQYRLAQIVDAPKPGYTYSRQAYTIEVYLDAADGAQIIVSDGSGAKTDSIVFENSYKAAPGGDTGSGSGGDSGGGNPGGGSNGGSNGGVDGGTGTGSGGSSGGSSPGTVPGVPPAPPANGQTDAAPTTTAPSKTAGPPAAVEPIEPPAATEPAAPPQPKSIGQMLAPATTSGTVYNTWSLLSLILSVTGALIALLLAVFSPIRKRRFDLMQTELEADGLLTEEAGERFDEYRNRGNTLRLLASIAGIATPAVWLLLDWPLTRMVWIDYWTPSVATAFILCLSLAVAYNIRKSGSGGRDSALHYVHLK